MKLTAGDLDAAVQEASTVYGVRWVAVFDDDDEVLAWAGPESREAAARMLDDEELARARSLLASVPEAAGIVWRSESSPKKCEVYLERLGSLWVLSVAFDPGLTSIGAIRLRTGPAKDRIVNLLLSD